MLRSDSLCGRSGNRFGALLLVSRAEVVYHISVLVFRVLVVVLASSRERGLTPMLEFGTHMSRLSVSSVGAVEHMAVRIRATKMPAGADAAGMAFCTGMVQ